MLPKIYEDIERIWETFNESHNRSPKSWADAEGLDGLFIEKTEEYNSEFSTEGLELICNLKGHESFQKLLEVCKETGNEEAMALLSQFVTTFLSGIRVGNQLAIERAVKAKEEMGELFYLPVKEEE